MWGGLRCVDAGMAKSSEKIRRRVRRVVIITL